MIKAVILLIITYIFNLIDYWQTTYAVQIFGLGVEANPVVRFLFEHNCAGIAKFIIPAILLICLGFIIKAERGLIWTAYLSFTIYLFVIIHNFIMFMKMGIL